MNQPQRKFLIEVIDRQYRNEREGIAAREPTEPSLNNYLIAAILDGSFVMRDASAIRASMQARVLSLGKDDALLSSSSHWNRSDGANSITLPASLLFELPPGYAKALEKYNDDLKVWQAEMAHLEACVAAMRLKVNIGSDKALEALVQQADKLCSMSLTASNQLLLGP